MNIPKYENEEEDAKILGGDNLDHIKKMEIKERVCEVCNKVFGSGKALGGHMRIHFQAYKDLIYKQNKKKKMRAHQSIKLKKFKNSMSTNSPTCTLCGKKFPSMKSLFGHMRCHPEREWRGIRPPSPRFGSKNSTFSWSTNSDVELIDDDLAKDEVFEPVNLLEVLPKWSVRAKRGRKAETNMVNEVVEEEFLEAVEDLMMLAKGGGDNLTQKQNKGEKFEVTNCNSLSNNNDDLIFKNKRERKKLKLRDLDQIQDSPPMFFNQTPPKVMAPLLATISPDEKYKCSICGKCFPTHQALGGHKSSHNKFRMFIQNSVDDHQYYSPPSVKKGRKENKENDEVVSHASGRVLDFDLNELPPSE